MGDRVRSLRALLTPLLTPLLAVLLLTGCTADAAPGELAAGQVVDPPFTVADQALTDLDGEPFSLTEDNTERLTLVFFGYTNCPQICGRVLGNLASALTRLEDAEREQVEVVFVTTDPARDTAPVIDDYLSRFDPSFRGLTGEVEQIRTVAASVGVGLGTELPSGGYEVDDHTTTTTGIDLGDQAPVYWGQDTTSAEFALDIRTLLGEP